MQHRTWNEALKSCALWLGVLCFATIAPQAFAQSSGSTAYAYEITPFLGINLPSKLEGNSGSLQVMGVRGASSLNAESALEAGFFVHHADPDRAYTVDFGYRYEMQVYNLEVLAMAGLHLSKFNIKPDYDSEGECLTADCATDSGNHMGFYLGGGLQVPLTPSLPLRLSTRLYKSPSLWVLIEVGLGIRF